MRLRPGLLLGGAKGDVGSSTLRLCRRSNSLSICSRATPSYAALGIHSGLSHALVPTRSSLYQTRMGHLPQLFNRAQFVNPSLVSSSNAST